MLKRKNKLQLKADELMFKREMKIADDFNSKQKDLVFLEEEVFSEKKELERVYKEKVEYDKYVDIKRNELLQLDEKIKAEKERLFVLNGVLAERKKEISNNDSKNCALLLEIQMNSDSLSKMEDKKKEAKEYLLSLRDKEQELKSNIDKLSQNTYSKTEELHKTNDQISKNISSQVSDLSELNRKKTNIRQELEEARVLLEEKEKTSKELAEDIKFKSQKRNHLKSIIRNSEESLNNRKKASEKELKSVTSALTTKRKEVEILSSEIKDKEYIKEVIGKEARGYDKEIDDKKIEIKKCEKIISQLTEVSERNSKIIEENKKSELEIARLSKMEAVRQLKLKEAEETYNNRKKEIGILNDKNIEIHSELLNTMSMLKQYKEEMYTREKDIKELAKRNNVLTERLEKVNTELEVTIKDKKEKLIELDTSISDRRNKLSELQKSYMSLSKTYSILQNKLKQNE